MRSASLNYKHLYYFWIVAREGGIGRASRVLHLTPQTISGQLRLFENSIKTRVFEKHGRGLKLTESGQLVLRYAKEIFALGDELQETLEGGEVSRKLRVVVGILDSIPKEIAYDILQPALKFGPDLTLTCIEGNFEQLVTELAINRLDVVLADMPLTASHNVKAFNHFLGESTISFFASPDKAASYRKRFPRCLHDAPMLMPTESSYSGRAVRQWLRDMDLVPKIKGYFDDSALLKAFGKAGEGVFFMPSIIEKQVMRDYNVKVIGTISEVSEMYYAITLNRRISHPAINAIYEAAKTRMFAHREY
ncbi:MAG: transcriptional activator NhaR [Pseudomonadota bacterium]